MTYKGLLINPWIYDFAAYNFWARPLGLLKVAEFLSQFNVEIKFIDCCDSFNEKRFGCGKYNFEIVEKPEFLREIPRRYKRYGIPFSEFRERVRRIKSIDFILVTSIMPYWWHGVRDVVDILRDFFRDTPIILGGIYATLYEEHARENINVNSVFRGALSQRLLSILEEFGVRLKRVRERPFLWWQLGLYRSMNYAPILTSTGCPFRCPYCASSLLYECFMQRDVDEVLSEIEGLYRLGIRDFAFYDDALLYRAKEHIIPILRRIINSRLNLRFHTPNGLHARFIDEEVALVMAKAGFKTVRLSLETVNRNRQIETGAKVFNQDLEKAVENLRKVGFSSRDIGVYIMYGLPNQDLAEVFAGVNFLKELKVRVHLTEFSPIRGTPYWQELIKEGKIADNIDPILTNNTLFSELFAGYPRKELERLKIEVNRYNQNLN